MEPKLDDDLGWNLEIFCDSDWAGGPETRISVAGIVIYSEFKVPERCHVIKH